MKTTMFTAAVLAASLALSACNKAEEPAPEDPKKTETEVVPMSAEPAEPTGVMSVEPVVLEESSGGQASINDIHTSGVAN